MEQPKNVAILVYNELTNQILCVSRKDNHEDFGLPGGKIEPGEGMLEAALRELKEETGITFELDEVIGTYPNQRLTYLNEYSEDSHTCTYIVRIGREVEIKTSENHRVVWSSSWEPLVKGSFSKYNLNLALHIAQYRNSYKWL